MEAEQKLEQIMYAEGTIIGGSMPGSVRIYIRTKYWQKLSQFKGKRVKMLMIIDP